jgi:hypothetical protein
MAANSTVMMLRGAKAVDVRWPRRRMTSETTTAL